MVLLPIVSSARDYCGPLSDRGEDRKHSACYLLHSHGQAEPFFPSSFSVVSFSDSWTFPAIVA